MPKLKLGPKTYLYPMSVTLIGATVDGKPNFAPIAWATVLEDEPPLILAVMDKEHHTSLGINQNKSFSVNIPSRKMLEATDFCGLVSGKSTDKSEVFDVFYGKDKTVPMITESPINLECRLDRVIDIGQSVSLFVGEVIEAYSEDGYLTNGKPDLGKMDLFVYSTKERNYYSVGEKIGQAWKIGKDFRK